MREHLIAEVLGPVWSYCRVEVQACQVDVGRCNVAGVVVAIAGCVVWYRGVRQPVVSDVGVDLYPACQSCHG